MEEIQIRPAKAEEWEDTMALAWRTFQKFEAPIYSQQGIDSFLSFISDAKLFMMFRLGAYQLFLATSYNSNSGTEKIVGMISVRNEKLISLLFVDEKYQRQGIGKKLVEYAAMNICENTHHSCCQVKAAPNATEFYHKLGFKDMGQATEYDGIVTIPMQLDF